MKKSMLALAVLSAFAGAASAQSSVTLSGGVDVAVQRQNGAWNMSTGNSARTNFTLSGKEDLGGGMNAFFSLNYRFNAATGQDTTTSSSTQFWRQSWVGLGGGFGDVRLGRMLGPLQNLNGDFDPFGTETIGSVHTGGLGAGLAGNARTNNQIYYRSPSLGGLQLHGSIAAGDQQIAGTPTTGYTDGAERPIGLAVSYGGGPLRAALAYDRNALDLKTIGVYGGYNFGFADLMFQFEKGENAGGLDDTKALSFGARVPLGAATFKVGYRHIKLEDAKAKKIGAGLDYNLSKRTIVYTDVSKQSGDVTTLQKKAQFDVGIWHKF